MICFDLFSRDEMNCIEKFRDKIMKTLGLRNHKSRLTYLIIRDIETLDAGGFQTLQPFLVPAFQQNFNNLLGFKLKLIFFSTLPFEDLKLDPRIPYVFFCNISKNHLHLPTLSERREDIPRLANLFLEAGLKEAGMENIKLPENFLKSCTDYDFPGNLAELEALIYYSVRGLRDGFSFSTSIANWMESHRKPQKNLRKNLENHKIAFCPNNLPTISETTHTLVQEAMKRAAGNQTKAAKLLGISQQALSVRLSQKKRS